MKRSRTMFLSTIVLSFALMSILSIDFQHFDASLNTEEFIVPQAEAKPSDDPSNNDKSGEAKVKAKSSGTHHEIEMWAVKMPDDMYAYKINSYTMDGTDMVKSSTNPDGIFTTAPQIPGPTLVFTEGDTATVTLHNKACDDNFINGPTHPLALPQYSENSMVGIHVHGVHYGIDDDASYKRMNMAEDSGALCGSSVVYEWDMERGTQGTWPYHDHTFYKNEVGAEDLGLFGTVIVNPHNGKIDGLVSSDSGKVKKLKVKDIDKEFVLWMVSSEVLGKSVFYGMEIDNAHSTAPGKQTALWTNPPLYAEEGTIVRYHVLGLGDETHAFHLHGHRWIDTTGGPADIIDVKEITPLQRHTFVVEVSDNGQDKTGSEGWMYHCHVFSHMQEGMSGMMMVVDDAELPDVGAVFTLSDEPGVWMKTLNAGIVEGLDEHFVDNIGLNIKTNDGTGFPLAFINQALTDAIPAAETDFSNSEGRSVAVINPGETVLFGMKDSQTKHTITTLIYPEDADPIGGNGIIRAAGLGHYDQQLGIRGTAMLSDTNGEPVGLDTPGLYVFVCKIHPYMFSAVIVDDPTTSVLVGGDPAKSIPLLDFSDNLTVLTRTGAELDNTDVEFGDTNTVFPTTIPTGHALGQSLLTTFFVITDPNNWRDYQEPNWTVSLPTVLITTTGTDVVGLAYNEGTTEFAAGALNLTYGDGSSIDLDDVGGLGLGGTFANPALTDPDTDGVGEVWINTQFERTVAKNHDGTPLDKPGTITVVDTQDWTVERKISLPQIDMNNPHNIWADKTNEVIYQTQWFGTEFAVIDRESGELITEVFTGQSPSHIMTSPTTDKIYVAMNGEDTVNEFDSNTLEMTKQISTGFRSHPHGHWVSSDGQYVVTPDFLGLKASIIDLEDNTVKSSDNILIGPIATGMKSDGDQIFYTADFLGNSMTAINPSTGTIVGHIDFLDQGLMGLPIQTPVSPDNQWMVTALTLGAKIAVIDVTSTPGTIVEILDCDPGCHGVQWGAKEGGGYYAYVSSKFSNAMIVIDPEGPTDGSPEEVGRILLADRIADNDDRPSQYDGFGGQGVLAIPNVYDGWIQQTVSACSVANACSDEMNMFLGNLELAQKDPNAP